MSIGSVDSSQASALYNLLSASSCRGGSDRGEYHSELHQQLEFDRKLNGQRGFDGRGVDESRYRIG